jgi:hypothetical protein
MNKREAMNYARVIERLHMWDFSTYEAETLFRIERTLQRWGERECGDANGGAIERDEKTGKPFWTYERGNGKRGRYAIPDRERGALKRLAKLMESHGSYIAYHQPDCRGCALYIVPAALLEGASIDSVYNRGLAICI